METKLRKFFDEMVVYKDLKKSNFLSALGLPSFLRDWLLKMFTDEEGTIDDKSLVEFVRAHLPDPDEWVSIKARIINDLEEVKILTRISADISIETGEVSFSLPDYGLRKVETMIDPNVWEEHRSELTRSQEVWGVVALSYRMPDDDGNKGKIVLSGFTDFCPYTINIDYFKDTRREFELEEWIDVLLGAIDYNAAGYESRDQKLAMLTRLLPFVEKRLNLIELAPKGTGKSYVFGHVSRFGMLTDGGRLTRAKMFYDMGKKTPGFVVGNDFIAVDEVKLVQFGDVNEMRSVLQGYMEYGQFNVAGYNGSSDAGIVFLGNIAAENWDEYKNMLSELPSLFQESALVDRIHGFIKGWEIPRMNDDLKISGWGLNSEYFSTILHELRSDASYRRIVDQMVVVPERADTRDTEAVKRIATAYLKLLFPNVRDVSDVNELEFKQFCLRPACRMRQTIKRQLGLLDSEFRGKDLPSYELRSRSA